MYLVEFLYFHFTLWHLFTLQNCCQNLIFVGIPLLNLSCFKYCKYYNTSMHLHRYNNMVLNLKWAAYLSTRSINNTPLCLWDTYKEQAKMFLKIKLKWVLNPSTVPHRNFDELIFIIVNALVFGRTSLFVLKY